jgi:uncharacterized membrane protein YdjX (TVP38/TMEM64 family)
VTVSRSAALKPLTRIKRRTAARADTCAPQKTDGRQSDRTRTTSKSEYVFLAVLGGGLLAALFVARAHASALSSFVDRNPVEGVALFLALNVLDAVIAPGISLPLIPVAAHAWGHVWAAIVTTAGWTTGSLIAFSIARRWGAPLVKKLTSMERLRQMKRYIPQDVFWSIVALRLVMPMDVLSYVLGLFTHISGRKYVAATAMGVTPPAFLLAYLGRLPHAYEIIAAGVGCAVLVAYIIVTRRRTCQPAPGGR